MKTCPNCAEEIQDAAVKCRYCGEWLEELDEITGTISRPKQRKRSVWRSAWLLWVLIGLLALVFWSRFESTRRPIPRRSETARLGKVNAVSLFLTKDAAKLYAQAHATGDKISQAGIAVSHEAVGLDLKEKPKVKILDNWTVKVPEQGVAYPLCKVMLLEGPHKDKVGWVPASIVIDE